MDDALLIQMAFFNSPSGVRITYALLSDRSCKNEKYFFLHEVPWTDKEHV